MITPLNAPPNYTSACAICFSRIPDLYSGFPDLAHFQSICKYSTFTHMFTNVGAATVSPLIPALLAAGWDVKAVARSLVPSELLTCVLSPSRPVQPAIGVDYAPGMQLVSCTTDECSSKFSESTSAGRYRVGDRDGFSGMCSWIYSCLWPLGQ